MVKRQLLALVDKKKVIKHNHGYNPLESDLHLEDAGGIDCLPTTTIFEELARIGNSLEGSRQRLLQFLTLVILHADVPNEDSVLCTFPCIYCSVCQARESKNLKLRVKKLEKKTGLRTHKFKSCTRSDDAEMFDTDALIGNEVFTENDMIEKDQDVISKEVSTAAPSTIVVSPPVITKSTTTTSPSIIPKAKGITFRDAGESTTRTPTSVSSSRIKVKGKAKMDEPEVPLKKKDQIALDEEMARNLEAQIQAELIEEERLARKKKEEANIALIESWDNTQAMTEADFELAQRLQAEE
ncbi:hypothetical protein Tco_0215759 [Tanacetum coccineum]